MWNICPVKFVNFVYFFLLAEKLYHYVEILLNLECAFQLG